MSHGEQGLHHLHEESASTGKWKEHVKVMKTWIRQPSSILMFALSTISILLLFIVIILIVTLSNGAVSQTEQSLSSRFRDLEVYVDSKVGGLSKDASSMLVKIQEIESSMTSFAKEKDVKDLGTKQEEIFSAVSNVDALQTDIQRVLTAVGKLTDATLHGNHTQDPQCTDGWRHFALSCYYVSSRLRPWSFAKKDCEERKSQMVIINTKEEQEEMRKISGYLNTWIGLTEVDGAWRWLDGSKVSSASSFWADNEPSSYHYYAEDCAHMNSDGFWDSKHCSSNFQYICEKKM
ncbi:asialoglycoprotein receptor 1-like [Phyllobates terribilis]|uniref:asialoglycoprotein receptor 1-like n=1 Tax=Phyllobates terribilis TaxID=111132 RepID=UPI003CCB6CB5